MVHLILYVPKNRQEFMLSHYQIFDEFVEWMFMMMEKGGFTFDIQYFEDNSEEIVNAGITDFTQPVIKDAEGNFIQGVENIKIFVESFIESTE